MEPNVDEITQRPVTEVEVNPAGPGWPDWLVVLIPPHAEQGFKLFGFFVSVEHARALYAKLGQALAALEG